MFGKSKRAANEVLHKLNSKIFHYDTPEHKAFYKITGAVNSATLGAVALGLMYGPQAAAVFMTAYVPTAAALLGVSIHRDEVKEAQARAPGAAI